MTNLASLLAEVEDLPDAPDAHWAIARERLLNLAPDLLEMVLGEVA